MFGGLYLLYLDFFKYEPFRLLCFVLSFFLLSLLYAISSYLSICFLDKNILILILFVNYLIEYNYSNNFIILSFMKKEPPPRRFPCEVSGSFFVTSHRLRRLKHSCGISITFHDHPSIAMCFDVSTFFCSTGFGTDRLKIPFSNFALMSSCFTSSPT